MSDSFVIDKDKAIEMDKKAAEQAGFDYEEWKRLMYIPATTIPNENSKHLKGYIFDSLVFRYKDIRDKLAMYEVPEYMAHFSCSKAEAETKSMQRATDDLLRFIRVLDDAIGEHD